MFDHSIRTTRDMMIYQSDRLFSDIKAMVEATRPMMVSPLFETKRGCQLYIKEKYGYLARRPDLRKEPHCWRMPKPVSVTVTVREAARG